MEVILEDLIHPRGQQEGIEPPPPVQLFTEKSPKLVEIQQQVMDQKRLLIPCIDQLHRRLKLGQRRRWWGQGRLGGVRVFHGWPRWCG